VTKIPVKTSVLNLSIEEENLAAIPFAVLERRVGKHVGKIEINGNMVLPDGTELKVVWQVQGNNELGLPTEQDLDIFVALGVLTFRNNFAKKVTFTGREIARILDIGTVHGKFYKRIKLAMDRFIPLRFRGITATDTQEEVKWCNVFQEASFSLDRTTGRCTGSVTWTDKLIQSMDSGFFRLLDAGRYMELDGITAKHLYRYLAVAFEKADLVLVDARQLCRERLGIMNPPHYLSRLMQTLEPAFEQLIRIQVLGSYHIVAAEEWRIALHRHPSYVPERKALLLQSRINDPEASRVYCQDLLHRTGLAAKVAAHYCNQAQTFDEFLVLERCGRILEAMAEEEVLPHVAVSVIRTALDQGATSGEGQALLDWCEIAVQVCRQKKRAGQTLKNSAGLLIKIVKDPAARSRLVNEELTASLRQSFRRREQAARRQKDEQDERVMVQEYQQYREQLARGIFDEMQDAAKSVQRKAKLEHLAQQERFQRISAEAQRHEIDDAILHDIAKRQAAPYEKWRFRKQAEQAVLPFTTQETAGTLHDSLLA
jgi:hypothetical protein